MDRTTRQIPLSHGGGKRGERVLLERERKKKGEESEREESEKQYDKIVIFDIRLMVFSARAQMEARCPKYDHAG